ncbi:MAG: alpha/beta fold hydrolase [Alphaproteobacteria bacterium]|nr:alpha/beta fold hydrolase [Alphaproteobacteria bacterium]
MASSSAVSVSRLPFRPRFPWIGGDLQTLRQVLKPGPQVVGPGTERRVVPLGDGDALVVAIDRPAQQRHPTLVLVHGLTGCEGSPPVIATARAAVLRGHAVVRVNLRGAGPSAPLCRGTYHAGRVEDLASVLQALAADPAADLVAPGVVLHGISLGGNQVLKLAAERSSESRVRAVVSVSAPIDLRAASNRFLAPRNWLYHRWLLGRMKAAAMPWSPAEAAAIASANTVWEFDDRFIAPRHGFDGAEDYYARCSAAPLVPTIQCPALLIHAETDPWIPADAYHALSPATGLTVLVARDGGHVGFHAAGSPEAWSDRQTFAWLAALGLSAPTPPPLDVRRR